MNKEIHKAIMVSSRLRTKFRKEKKLYLAEMHIIKKLLHKIDKSKQN